MSKVDAAHIAAVWDGMSDRAKVRELGRWATAAESKGPDTKAGLAKAQAEIDVAHAKMCDILGKLVVKIRKEARCFAQPTYRAKLAANYELRLRRSFRGSDVSPDLVERICNVLRAETVGWPGFGTKIYRDDEV